MRTLAVIVACLSLAACAVTPGGATVDAAGSATVVWQDALADWRSGKTDRALARLDQMASQGDAAVKESYRALGGVLADADDRQDLVGLVTAFADARPGDADLGLALVGIHLRLADVQAARERLATVIAHHPASMDAHWTMGLLMLRAGEPDGAETHLRALLDDPARRPDAMYFIGGAHEMRGEHSGALEWFDGVSTGDHFFNARIKSVQMLFQLDRAPEGRARLVQLRAERPEERAGIYRAEAELLLRHDRQVDALQVYDRALAEIPDEPDLRYARALLRERSGDVVGAIDDLRVLYAAHPESPVVQNALGYTLADRGTHADWPEARRLIQLALEQEPDNPAYLDSKGWVLYRMGETEAARSWLERAWGSVPDAEVGAHLGEVLWVLGEEQLAKEVWMDSAIVDPDHPVLKRTLDRFLSP